MIKIYLRILVFMCVFSGLFLACAGPPVNSNEPADEVKAESFVEHVQEQSPEKVPDASEPSGDASSEPEPEPVPDASLEPTPETSPEIPESVVETMPEPEPKTCQAGEACNALLDGQGKCPGACIKQTTTVTCRGTVVHGLCYRTPPKRTNGPKTIAGLLFQPETIPDLVQEGETKTFRIRVTNTLSQDNNVPFSYTVEPEWQLVDASFKDLTSLDFKANETKTLTMTMRALKANIFESNRSSGNIISFQFHRDLFSIVTTIGYPAKGNVACGKNYFPATYCPNSSCSQGRDFYYQGVCCQEVFYPGAECCTASDCQGGGGCFDGKCMEAQPKFLANTLSMGHHRVLIVVSDDLNLPHDPSKVCTNRYNDLKGRLKLDDFEAYVQKFSQRYTGRPGPKYQWWVLGGINTSDFNPQGGRTLRSMHDALEKYLLAKGCIKGPHEFDKKMLITPNLDIGSFTGKAEIDGRMGMKKMDMLLFVHELMHTYGASDLYLNLGGKLQYLFDLMGNNLGQYGEPEFGVTWGEILWGDANQNGVIDVFEFALYPDSITATKLLARVTAKNTLEVGASVEATEAGVTKRIMIHTVTVELPDFNAKTTMPPGSIVVFDSNQVDLNKIQQKGSVKVRISASYHYTDKNFVRKEYKLDTVTDVPLTK